MHRPSPLLPTLAAALILVALPAGLHAQSMDKTSKDPKPAMGAMADTSKHTASGMDHGAMGQDAMAKDGMHDDKAMAGQKARTKSKPKASAGMADQGTMAEPAKTSHP
jgi:hypothetical protein